MTPVQAIIAGSDVSAPELARRVGFTTQRVYSLARSANPRAATVAKLADAAGVALRARTTSEGVTWYAVRAEDRVPSLLASLVCRSCGASIDTAPLTRAELATLVETHRCKPATLMVNGVMHW